MDDLVQWLGQQLDEDERIARATEWCAGTRTFNGWDAARVDEVDWEIRSRNAVIGSGLGEEFARYMAEWDPARVLREITAKRQLLDLHGLVHRDLLWIDETSEERTAEIPVCGHCVPRHSSFSHPSAVPQGPCTTLRLLALPYADRPGYRDDWRP